MTRNIDAPYKDTSSKELSYAFNLETQEALLTKTLKFDDIEIQLRILGASHQIQVRTAKTTFSETVACLNDPLAERLPAKKEIPLEDGMYSFRSNVTTLSEPLFLEEVEIIKETTKGEFTLSAAFPGSPYALTALKLEQYGKTYTWTTWHVYPQHLEIVKTQGELTL